MQCISGIATRLRHTAEVYGNNHGVGTAQILVFRIGSQAVELNMPCLPRIEEGDDVVVVGDLKSGTLQGRAYLNYSTGSYGRWTRHSLILNFLCSLFVIVCWAFISIVTLGMMLSASGLSRGPAFLIAVAVPVFVVGRQWFRHLVDEVKTRQALWMVRR